MSKPMGITWNRENAAKQSVTIAEMLSDAFSGGGNVASVCIDCGYESCTCSTSRTYCAIPACGCDGSAGAHP